MAVILARLQGAAHEAAHDAGVPSVTTLVTSWRQRIHGPGYKNDKDFLKNEAKRICGELGVEVPDADAAEAVLIGRDAVACGLDRLRAEEKDTKKAQHRRAVKVRKTERAAQKASAPFTKKRAAA
ncbi:hypothetical protein NPA31_005215 [Aurantimonas sp. MSK8Z-1]|uniref:hypothetical protein n=1 Tax=Mangrovibrevibacter kandeliae TaxID=2968473 RepID=UPI0021192428|nr:hypothetical protein [Aurantimonas sp. MSK8Z-1]MCW4114361.1 hypothetical protein [Aurantimonas sp. MSK8Z-1]